MSDSQAEKDSYNIPLDLTMFHNLEERAHSLSEDFNGTVARLKDHMNQMSTWTADAGEVYTSSVKQLAKEIEVCTSKTVGLITQCDELDKDFAQLVDLSRQIKALDRALGQLQQAILK
ncbi:hypothetical protein CLU79DRAFT_746694 [Phycomyces nitens]|nr:hypothetical protein CLU79DRAFT_746694 [Phycomyces nitens]